MMTIFAGCGLLLAGAGVYGSLSYSVAARIQEIGVPMALGADRRDVTTSVLRSTLILLGTRRTVRGKRHSFADSSRGELQNP